MSKKAEQLANERQTAEISGTYAENIQREGTKQELVKALAAKFSQPQQAGVSPIAVLLLVMVVIFGFAFVKKQGNNAESK